MTDSRFLLPMNQPYCSNALCDFHKNTLAILGTGTNLLTILNGSMLYVHTIWEAELKIIHSAIMLEFTCVDHFGF